MTIDTNDMLKSILDSFSRIDYIRPKDIPNIDLYMDQVTTFMDAQLSSTKRYADDKILTKTMINNYAKNNLLPPPVKKKYSKEHVLVLIFIYYFKNILSIKDIETVLRPITDDAFSEDPGIDMKALYEEICAMEKGRVDSLKDDISDAFTKAEESFSDADIKDKDYLQLFTFLCNLSFDVYVKKLLIEKIIDELPSSEKKPGKK